MWLQREKPYQAWVWATKVTGIIRHWADLHFLINKLVLLIHSLMGLKGTSGSYLVHPWLRCFSMLFPQPWPYNMTHSNAESTSWGFCMRTSTIRYSRRIGRNSWATEPFCNRVSNIAWRLRQGFVGLSGLVFQSAFVVWYISCWRR